MGRPAWLHLLAVALVPAAGGQTALHFDVNGIVSGSGLVPGATYDWAGIFWADQPNGANGGHPAGLWIPSSNAVFSAGTDGNIAYTVNINAHTLVGTVTIEEGTPAFRVGTGAVWTFATATSFTLASSIGGDGGVALISTGTITLDGANTWTGGTTIVAGTLRFSAPVAMPAASAFTLGGGTIAAGATGTFATTGPLALVGSSAIDFGPGLGATTFSFGASAGTVWAPGSTLAILNYSSASSDQLRFGTTASALTALQLSQITFSGFAPGATIDANGFLAPVPELETYAALLGSAGFCAVWLKRARARAPKQAGVALKKGARRRGSE